MIAVIPLAPVGARYAYEVLRPRPRARICSLDTNAIGSMRAYASAQSMYHRWDWDGDGKMAYAPRFPQLHDQVDGEGNQIQLIDSAFAGATAWSGTPKHGYCFRDMNTLGGEPIDWTKDFALCATPSTYGRTGYRTFIVSTDGTVWGKDLGYSVLLADFPVDPELDGWEIAG